MSLIIILVFTIIMIGILLLVFAPPFLLRLRDRKLAEMGRSGQSKMLIDELDFIPLIVLTTDNPAGVESKAESEETFRELLEEVVEKNIESTNPFYIGRDGKSYFPVFTGMTRVKMFVQSLAEDRIMPFCVNEMERGTDLTAQFSHGDGVVINPGTPFEYILTSEDIEAYDNKKRA